MSERERKRKETAVPPQEAKQVSSNPAEWSWVDRSVWTDRMLAALGNGVKGNRWFSSGRWTRSSADDYVRFCANNRSVWAGVVHTPITAAGLIDTSLTQGCSP